MSRRLPEGGRIDRSRPLSFTFDGRRITGFAGDTLASALLANGVKLVGRSFKYHRPRGIFTAGPEEPNALVTLNGGSRRTPNVPATTVELRDGLVAESQNRWPSLTCDFQAVNSLLAPLLPAGFYYKTFMGPTRRAWMAYETWIRRAAGLGIAGQAPDPDRYEVSHAFCDVAVIGAGPAGLAAALRAGRAGARVVLIEQEFLLGGQLLARSSGGLSDGWLREMVEALSALPNLRIMTRTTAFGVYDGGTLGLVKTRDHEVPNPAKGEARQEHILLRCRTVVFATGAIERPLVFSGNDRPGVMLASAARTYLHRYGVLAGDDVIVATDNDSAYHVAIELAGAGARVQVIDMRETAPVAPAAAAATAGIAVRAGATKLTARGGHRLRSLEVHWGERSKEVLPTNLLCVSGGWSPTVHLTSHLGGRPAYRGDIGAFVAGQLTSDQFAAGAITGAGDSASAVAEGWIAGSAAVGRCGTRDQDMPAPVFPAQEREFCAGSVAAKPNERLQGKAFVDLQNDVTVADVELAHREGYISIEHLKRYTTLGMGTDQGKTSNWNAWQITAALSDALPEKLGTTTFRPPYTPVAIGALAGRSVGRQFRPTRLTPLHEWHLENGAEMMEVGLWLRPWFYRGNGANVDEAYIREMSVVREAAGLADVSTLGKIQVEGADALQFLSRVYANDVTRLQNNRVRYGVMLRDDGIVFDDGTVTRLDEHRFFLTTSTAKAADVMSWLEFLRDTAWKTLDVHVTSVTDDWAAMSLAGPQSRQVLAQAFPNLNVAGPSLPPQGVLIAEDNGSPMRILRVSYSGELAFEIYVASHRSRDVWERLMAAGEPLGLRPYGMEALGALRIEKGHVAGPEIDGRTTMMDLGLDRMASRVRHYVGAVLAERPALLTADRPGLVGLECLESGKRLRSGAALFATSDPTTGHGRGRVTSVTWSPTLDRYIGLGFYEGGLAHAGMEVVATHLLHEERVRARIVKPVFVDPSGERLRA